MVFVKGKKPTLVKKPTSRQRAVVEALVAKGGSVSSAMRKAGYSQAMVKNPHKLTQSKGFLELLDEAGLTEEFLNNALYDDIRTKKGWRVQELTLAYRLRGSLDNPSNNVKADTININFINTLDTP